MCMIPSPILHLSTTASSGVTLCNTHVNNCEVDLTAKGTHSHRVKVPFEFLGNLVGKFTARYRLAVLSPAQRMNLSPCGERAVAWSVGWAYLTQVTVIRVSGELGVRLALPLRQKTTTGNIHLTCTKWALQNLGALGRPGRRDPQNSCGVHFRALCLDGRTY